MRPKLEFKFAIFLAIWAAMFIQGCGGSGSGTSSSSVDPASANSKPQDQSLAESDSEASIHPLFGPAGSTVAISGRGFADACGAALFVGELGGESLTEASISDGAFRVQAVLPAMLDSGRTA